MSFPVAAKHIAGPAFVLLLTGLFSLFPSYFQPHFAYDRILIGSYELWRLFTGNLLHTNAMHYVLNATGIVLLWALHGEYYRTSSYLIRLALMGLGCTLGLFWFSTELIWYVGLSGALHGLFVWGAIQDVRYGIKSGWLLLIGVAAKLVAEQWYGASAQISEWINASVAVDAHLYGAISGLLIGTIEIIKRVSAEK